MSFKVMTLAIALALVLVTGLVALPLAPGLRVASASAQSERSGALHVTKNCAAFTGAPGSY
jgi:hypothetical protein